MRGSAVRRFGSYFVDNIIIGVIQIPIALFASGGIMGQIDSALKLENNLITFNEYMIDYWNWIKMLLIISFAIMAIYYVVLPLIWDGKTFGRKICGVQLKKIDGSKLTFATLFVREIIFKTLWWAVTLGVGQLVDLLMVATREDKQTIRDMITGTEIIENEGETVKREYSDF